MDAEKLEEFYSLHPLNLDMITDLNRRHFRFLLSNGRFFKVRDRIASAQDLQSWLLRLRPQDVYYSTSTYLNPTSVATRPKKASDYWGPGNVVLGHDLAFDIDRRPLSLLNLERARKDAVKLLDYMLRRGHPLRYVAFSGSKGFHLVFHDPDGHIEEDYRIREKAIIESRKTLVSEVLKAGIGIDAAVTIDTRRIIRVPGTLNSKTGYCCQPMPPEQLRRPVAGWIETVPRLEDHVPIPRFNLASRFHAQGKKAVQDKGQGGGIGYSTFVTSSVLGTKGRHAVLISLQKSTLEAAVRRLRSVQETYELTDIYLFELPQAYQAICLKTVQRNRYQKILDHVRSPSAHQLRKYDRVSLRMGPLVDGDLRPLEPPAEFVTILECPEEVRGSNFVSSGHLNFLERHGMTPMEYPLKHGSGEFQLVDAEIRL